MNEEVPVQTNQAPNDVILQSFLAKVERVADRQKRSLSLSSLCEPTPINVNSSCVVDQVPLSQASWHNDDRFLNCLQTLILESRGRNSAPTNESAVRGALKPLYMEQAQVQKNRGGQEASSSPSATSTEILCPEPPMKRRRGSAQSLGEESVASSGSESGLRNSHVEQWNQRYMELVAFRNEFQHCLVPLNWARNQSLAHWVKRQRYQYRIKTEGKHSTMTEERQASLESLGFVWDSHAAAWEERWDELRKFKDRYGHTNVPKKYPENPQLAVWVKCQRRQHKLFSEGSSSNMTVARIERLKALGFVFNPRMKAKVRDI